MTIPKYKVGDVVKATAKNDAGKESTRTATIAAVEIAHGKPMYAVETSAGQRAILDEDRLTYLKTGKLPDDSEEAAFFLHLVNSLPDISNDREDEEKTA